MPLSESLKQPKYRILGLVGHGQFGQVFCAVHRQTGQLVALKNLERQRFPTHQFLRELRFLLSLQHKYIVSCYAIEHTQTGRYLVMDYCEGGTLRGLMEEENHLCIEQTLQIICHVLQGLEHAHERGIVHCDIKPENILLCLQPKGWIAKISDFGIARLSQELSKQGTSNTGSPAYMAPERFYGQYSPTSDLYSVGIMLFELLAGYRPFTGAPGALMGAHLNEHVRFSDIVPEALQPIIHKSLQKLSARRFRSAAEMLAALQRAAADLNISLDSSAFSLDKPLLESRVVPIACPFDASQCDRLQIAPVHLDAAAGTRCDSEMSHSGVEKSLKDAREPMAKQTAYASQPPPPSQDMLIAYGAADQLGLQLRMTGIPLSMRRVQVSQTLATTALSDALSSQAVVHEKGVRESTLLDNRPLPNSAQSEKSSQIADQLGSDFDEIFNGKSPGALESSDDKDSEAEVRQGLVKASVSSPPAAGAIASQTVSTLSASALFYQPIQGIAVRPQGCYVMTQHTLHLLSNHQIYQSEPVAELIHQFEQDCTSALDTTGCWIATVTDMRQIVPKSGFSTLSFYPLRSEGSSPLLVSHPVRLTLAGEASALLQVIALDSRHVAVVSDIPSMGISTATHTKKKRSPKAHSGGTYIEVFTRRGQLVGALSLPILLGQVILTATPYRLLATDQYDLYSILQIDLKPFRVVRFAVQIVPQFLVAASWGYVVMNAQGHIILLDQQGCQVNRIEGPANPTAIAMIEPSTLLIATQDKSYGRLYTVNLKELGVDILF